MVACPSAHDLVAPLHSEVEKQWLWGHHLAKTNTMGTDPSLRFQQIFHPNLHLWSYGGSHAHDHYLLPFLVMNLILSKPSMHHKIQQQDQYVSVRRPYIYVSLNGISDCIDYIHRMMFSSSWLCQGVGLVNLNSDTPNDHHLHWRTLVCLQYSINMSVGEDCICLGGREQLLEGDLSNDYEKWMIIISQSFSYLIVIRHKIQDPPSW